VSATLGGMLYVGAGVTLTILSSNISNIQAKSGAAMYISGVVSVINSSRFVNLTALNGQGGAIFFGADSGFSLYGVYSFLCRIVINHHFFFFFFI
jgi:hypothetical protein